MTTHSEDWTEREKGGWIELGWVESCAAPWEGEGGEFYCEHGICVRIGQEIPDLRSSFKNNVALNFNRGLEKAFCLTKYFLRTYSTSVGINLGTIHIDQGSEDEWNESPDSSVSRHFVGKVHRQVLIFRHFLAASDVSWAVSNYKSLCKILQM